MSSAIAILQSPVGCVRALGSRLWWGVPGVCGVLSAYSYFPVPTQPGEQNIADWVVISLVGFLTTACGAILVACGVWWDLSVNFDCAPWRVAQEEALAAAAKGTDPQSVPLTCPFYASEPAETQCGACGTVVSRSGLHEEKVTGTGEIVLDWGRAMEAVERKDDTRLARADLDAALDFTGNPAMCQINKCCIGCYIHQRCHNVLPRLAQMCIYSAVVLAFAPWAFWKLFVNLPPGFNGLAGVCAACWASAALLLALDAVATPLAFMRRYRWVPFPFPNGVFDDRWRDVLCGLFAAALP